MSYIVPRNSLFNLLNIEKGLAGYAAEGVFSWERMGTMGTGRPPGARGAD